MVTFNVCNYVAALKQKQYIYYLDGVANFVAKFLMHNLFLEHLSDLYYKENKELLLQNFFMFNRPIGNDLDTNNKCLKSS